jgi:hypothetical protein
MALEWEEELKDALIEDLDLDTKEKFLPLVTADFVKESFQNILQLHEEILLSKDEQIKQLKEEKDFLKESLLTVQKLYTEDRELLELLKKEIHDLQEELEFTRRKYKMMWNQAIENYSKK